jgi:undecaprenyl-diphosphatase
LEIDQRSNSLRAAVWQIINFFGLRLLVGLAAATFCLLFFGWLAREVLEGETANFDNAVRFYIHDFAAPPLTFLMQTASFLGSTLFLILLGLLIAVLFYRAKWRRALIFFLATMAGAILLNFALKNGFERARPEPYFDTPLPSSYSFPSGHALFAVCFYAVVARLCTARIESARTKTLIWILAILLILAIGVSRIYLGVHYPSDVIAGYAAAIVWVAAVTLGDFLIRRRTNR